MYCFAACNKCRVRFSRANQSYVAGVFLYAGVQPADAQPDWVQSFLVTKKTTHQFASNADDYWCVIAVYPDVRHGNCMFL